MNTNDVLTTSGNLFTYVLAGIQTNQVFQIIQLILAVLTSLVILVKKIIDWWKESKKDGKINKEEIDKGIDILKDGVKEITETISNYKENKKDEEIR